MLITHLRPSELWGKKVYDADGRYLGAVVAIGSRRGVTRKVVVQSKAHGAPVRLLPPARDGAATAPMSYLGLPLGAEARRLASRSPNWDAGPGTGSYNERQSARAV